VSVDTPFNREVLELSDGRQCGIIVNRDPAAVASAIDRLEADAGLVDSLGSLARRRIAEAFTWDRVARQYETLYLGLVEGVPLPELRARVSAVPGSDPVAAIA
jgi:glycosyltransferase involved in cell wall biosynthesis